ncbi:uncharacterized protein A1O5_04376 [Cladophialophora psammophila CBS 110553]|uniref:Uncharacterized protein n=1 Tax=Cladophialophora psammophila CBS 110553 TaxID=1182543 RepID=W9X3M1_9EURO|nr:uncharacterized protein A1O5_04376 [Cladophialophora psammophila CBS 110553]EXJ71875.1 hypothetical protein A1O5_04376 [Cladophialophora psammophila CBS 110553]
MTGLGIGGAGGAAAGMGAVAAVSSRYRDISNPSDTRSELPSPPIPPPRSPDRLLPPGVVPMRYQPSSSPPPPNQGSSHMSVSDQSEYSQGNNQYPPGGQYPPQPPNAAGAGYFGNLNELPEDQRNIHQLPDDQVSNPMSHQSYQHANMGQDGYWSGQPSAPSGHSGPSAPSVPSAQESYELPGQSHTPAPAQPQGGQGGYRGTDREVPLHQRVEGRVPYRPGHLPPSHNY